MSNVTPIRPRHLVGAFAVHVTDDANAPELAPGDLVFVDPGRDRNSKRFVVVESPAD